MDKFNIYIYIGLEEMAADKMRGTTSVNRCVVTASLSNRDCAHTQPGFVTWRGKTSRQRIGVPQSYRD
jgi:hypothetical protein